MTQLLDEAADALERNLFFHGLERRYEQLHRDEEAWGEIEDERRVEASSLRDQSE
jgi:hypothetical protein